MTMRNFFCMISKGDVPLYEVHLSPPPPRAGGPAGGSGGGREDLLQFILHASLDSVDAKLWQSSGMYLRNVDRFNDLMISALITPGHIRMLLLHDQRTDEGAIRAFFFDAYDLYVKVHTHTATARHCTLIVYASATSHTRGAHLHPVLFLPVSSAASAAAGVCVCVMQLLLNPFYDKASVITSRAFDERIRAIGDKYLNR